jgi:hypothetical protein
MLLLRGRSSLLTKIARLPQVTKKICRLEALPLDSLTDNDACASGIMSSLLGIRPEEICDRLLAKVPHKFFLELTEMIRMEYRTALARAKANWETEAQVFRMIGQERFSRIEESLEKLAKKWNLQTIWAPTISPGHHYLKVVHENFVFTQTRLSILGYPRRAAHRSQLACATQADWIQEQGETLSMIRGDSEIYCLIEHGSSKEDLGELGCAFIAFPRNTSLTLQHCKPLDLLNLNAKLSEHQPQEIQKVPIVLRPNIAKRKEAQGG